MGDGKKLTHFNESGRARMVDVSDKGESLRTATAAAKVLVSAETLALIKEGRAKKGDVLGVAQVAGIMAAKKNADIIPMCHPLRITGVDIEFKIDDDSSLVDIEATVRCKG